MAVSYKKAVASADREGHDHNDSSAASRIFIQYRSPDEAKRLCILRKNRKYLPDVELRRR